MIPQQAIDFIKKEGLIVYLGTRDANLQPTLVDCSGIFMCDAQTMAVLIKENAAATTLQNVKDNGRVAITAAYPPEHSSQQFKGQYISHAKCTAEELASAKKNLETLSDLLEPFYGAAVTTIRNIDLGDAISLKFKIEDIFNQTPGPGAGKKIN